MQQGLGQRPKQPQSTMHSQRRKPGIASHGKPGEWTVNTYQPSGIRDGATLGNRRIGSVNGVSDTFIQTGQRLIDELADDRQALAVQRLREHREDVKERNLPHPHRQQADAQTDRKPTNRQQ